MEKFGNDFGFSMIEVVISLALFSLLSISIWKFIYTTSATTKDIDRSFKVEDQVNYAAEFIKEYIESMDRIEYFEEDISQASDINGGMSIKKVYFSNGKQYFNLGTKVKYENGKNRKALVFNREENPDIFMSPSKGSEVISYYVDDIIAVPLPTSASVYEAEGIRFIFRWKGKTGKYEFEKTIWLQSY